MSVLTARQMTFVSGCSMMRQHLYGVACSKMITGISGKQPWHFWVSPSTIVCGLFCVFNVSVCAHSATGDLRQQIFDTETVTTWHTTLRDNALVVRKEALNVLGLAINHSMLPLLSSVCAYSGTGGLRQQMFDTETASVLRSMFHDDYWIIRQEALKVLGLVVDHSTLPIWPCCLCSQMNRCPSSAYVR